MLLVLPKSPLWDLRAKEERQLWEAQSDDVIGAKQGNRQAGKQMNLQFELEAIYQISKNGWTAQEWGKLFLQLKFLKDITIFSETYTGLILRRETFSFSSRPALC